MIIRCIKLKVQCKKIIVFCVIATIIVLINETKLKLTKDIFKEYIGQKSKAENSQNIEGLKEHLKTILFWTPLNYDPLYYLNEKGQKGFVRHKCRITNCYATDDRNLFGDNITKFDAIVFNGQTFKSKSSLFDLPKNRSKHQKYIFYETQSAGDYPICLKQLDNFFNWTMTYRLDSDIPCPFIVVKNKTGHIIGPREGIIWQRSKHNELYQNKRKAVAWFPTDCTSRTEAMMFSYTLKEALMAYKLDVHVYGNCGPLVCVRGNRECDYIQRDYFYMLALENSKAKDYVTDKVLIALQNNVVPIVYGGANYESFLPPGSYIDGTIQIPENIAEIVVKSMANISFYQRFMEWKELYSFHKAKQTDNVCSLCAAVNDEEKMKELKIYSNLRKWWNPEYIEACCH